MTDARPLKAAMIGLRNHAGSLDPTKSHGLLKTFKVLPGVEVVAYCEPAPEQAANLAAIAQFDPQARRYTALDDLLANEEFDIAAMMMPPNEVTVAARRLIELGKHLYIEKHAARTAPEMRPLVELARARGVVVQIGFPWANQPVAQEISRLRDQGILGKLVDIEMRHVTTSFGPGLRDPQNWAFRRATEGGGMLHQQGCHWLALMLAFAQSRVRSVIALCSRVNGLILDDLEDVSTVILEFQNGIHASLHNGFLLPRVGPSGDATVIVRGTQGHVTWDPLQDKPFTVISAHPAWQSAPVRTMSFPKVERPVYGGEAGFQFVSGFIRAVQTGSPVLVSMEDGLHVLEIIDAAYESARTGRRVELA